MFCKETQEKMECPKCNLEINKDCMIFHKRFSRCKYMWQCKSCEKVITFGHSEREKFINEPKLECKVYIDMKKCPSCNFKHLDSEDCKLKVKPVPMFENEPKIVTVSGSISKKIKQFMLPVM